MSVVPGERLGPYEVVARVGAGGMGEVWRARDTRLDRSVAIKVLPAHLSADTQFRERFEREARTISALTHPLSYLLVAAGWASLLIWKWDALQQWLLSFSPAHAVENVALAATRSR